MNPVLWLRGSLLTAMSSTGQNMGFGALEHRAEPFLRSLHWDFLASSVRGDLVLSYFSNCKVLAALASKVQPADGRSWLHGKALCESDSGPFSDSHQIPHCLLFQVIWL